MTEILSETAKQELTHLANCLRDVANDIDRQVRRGEVWTHDLELWLKIKKLMEE